MKYQTAFSFSYTGEKENAVFFGRRKGKKKPLVQRVVLIHDLFSIFYIIVNCIMLKLHTLAEDIYRKLDCSIVM